MIDQYEAPLTSEYNDREKSLSSDRQLGAYSPLGKGDDFQSQRLGIIEERNATYASSRHSIGSPPKSLGERIYRLFNLEKRTGYDQANRAAPESKSSLQMQSPVSAKEAVSRVYQKS